MCRMFLAAAGYFLIEQKNCKVILRRTKQLHVGTISTDNEENGCLCCLTGRSPSWPWKLREGNGATDRLIVVSIGIRQQGAGGRVN